ncbi:homoserine O-acetyltransferase [Striga asiatica]|uniref:Homoserine O-acetyltransferase n=1 Tax=Striga asiatica TaxID=4170 RepID=A0A5A7RG55_STRAF|nr:homoserine O-acetyltransferase [Striga asiatica]
MAFSSCRIFPGNLGLQIIDQLLSVLGQNRVSSQQVEEKCWFPKQEAVPSYVALKITPALTKLNLKTDGDISFPIHQEERAYGKLATNHTKVEHIPDWFRPALGSSGEQLQLPTSFVLLYQTSITRTPKNIKTGKSNSSHLFPTNHGTCFMPLEFPPLPPIIIHRTKPPTGSFHALRPVYNELMGLLSLIRARMGIICMRFVGKRTAKSYHSMFDVFEEKVTTSECFRVTEAFRKGGNQ